MKSSNASVLQLQLFYAGGMPSGNPITVTKSNPKDLPEGVDSPAVAELSGTDTFVVMYLDMNGDNLQLQSQLFQTRSGERVGTPFNPLYGRDPKNMLWTNMVSLSSYGQMSSNAAVMVWEESRENMNSIYVCLLSGKGLAQPGFPYQISQPSGTKSYKPSITNSQGYSGTSGYAIVYTQLDGKGGASIIMNIFPNATKTENVQVEVVRDCEDCLFNSSIGQMVGAGYVVVWEKRTAGATPMLYFSTFTEKGEIVADAVQFTFAGQSNSKPKVQGLNRGFVACWNNESTNPFSSMCEVFNSDGKADGSPFMIMN